MKQKIANVLLLLSMAAILVSSQGCKSKPKDADLQNSVQAALRANPRTAGLSASVNDGKAVISGEVTEAAAKNTATDVAKEVKGVESVENNVTIAEPAPVAPPSVDITPDATLLNGVKDATKDFPSVTATTEDGVIFVKGELKADQWKKLKMSLDGLNPKRVDAKDLKISK